ncbi:MAG: beta-ribofuranosylaminobenzene 5'-phosphate synthase family protein [Gemmataceae bacterium]
MIRLRAPSRLHFGLLSLATETHWPNLNGDAIVPARRFGSVGLMVQHPGLCVTASASASWSATGPLAERALAYARRFIETLPPPLARPQRLHIEQAAPEHAGLGTGTQLGLTIARLLGHAYGLPRLDAVDLARRVGRGQRSALGIHGFAHGGFLIEGGRSEGEAIAPLITRIDFPTDWRVLLVLPAGETGLHGAAELAAFARLKQPGQQPLALTEALCRLALLGLAPALRARDLLAFGEALYDFNARVGAAFAPAQGGIYASSRLAEIVSFIRQQNVPGVGQSSWGPTLFAVVGDSAHAIHLANRLREQFALTESEVIVAAACNQGARVESSSAVS